MKRTLMRTLAALSAMILYCSSLPTFPLSADTGANQSADTEETKELYLGDFNGDDQLTVMDAVLLSRFIAEDTTLNAVVYPEAGDMDENDIFNIADLSLMLSQLLGIYDTPGELPDKMGCIYQIREEIPVSDEASAREAIVQTAEQLGITVSETAEEFVLSDVSSNTNHTFYTMQQQYQGVDIYGGSLRLAVNEDGFCDTIINGFAKLPEEIDIDAEQTPEQVQETLEQNTEDVTVLYCEYQHTWLNAENGRLMYEFYVTAESEEQYGNYSAFTDADSAEILAWYCNDSSASTKRSYSDDDVTVDLNLESVDGGGYCLEDTKRNIFVFDANQRYFYRGITRFVPTPHDPIDSVRSDDITFSDSETQRDALKLMAYIANAQDYYTQKLGFNKTLATYASNNDAGSHGLFARSSYEQEYKGIHFVIIGTENSSYIKPDIVAHEYTHNILKTYNKFCSLVDLSSNMTLKDLIKADFDYDDIAVNEAYADVLAMCITKNTNWVFGEGTEAERDLKTIGFPVHLLNSHEASRHISNIAYKMYEHYTKKDSLFYSGFGLSSDKAFDKIASIWFESIDYLPTNRIEIEINLNPLAALMDPRTYITTPSYFAYALETAAKFQCSEKEQKMIHRCLLENGFSMPDIMIIGEDTKKVQANSMHLGSSQIVTETTTDAITFDDGKLYFYPNESINRAEVELSIEKYNGDNKLKVHALRDDPEADFDVVEIGMNLPDAVGLENVSKISHIQIEFTCVAQEPWVKDDGSSELVVGLMMGALGGQLADEKRYDDDFHIIQNTWTQSNFLFEDWQSPEHSWVFESDGPFNTLPGNKFAENYEGAALIVMRWSQRNAVDFYIDNIAFYDAEDNIIPIIST